MKKWLCLSCFLFLAFFPFAAEGAEEEPNEYTLKGKTAVLFYFNGLDLSPYEGGIGIKMGISRLTALLVSLEFNYYKDVTEVTNDDPGYEYKQSRMGIMVGFENHLGRVKSVSPYWGVSLGFGQTKFYDKYTSPLEPPTGMLFSEEERLFYINPRVFVGFEVKIIDKVSLAGQYTFGFEHASGTIEDSWLSVTTKQDVKATWVSVGTSSVILTIYL